MKLSSIKGLALAAAVSALCLPAHAAVTQLSSASQLNSGDVVVTIPGADQSMPASPLTVQQGDNTLTFTAAGGSFFRQNSDGTNFDFAAGTPLLETNSGGSFATATGPLTLSFSRGVTEFGLQAQDFAPDNEIFNFTVDSQSGTQMFTTGTLDNTSGQGMAAFIGAAGTPTDLISSVTVSSVSDQIGASNDFLTGNVTVPVPEPSSTAALCLGAAGLLGLVFARKRAQSPTA